MGSGKIILILLAITFAFVTPAVSKTEDGKDFAVPAFSDLPLLGTPNVNTINTQVLGPNKFREQLTSLPVVKQVQWLDINRDLQLNDFDVKQFQAIIERLHGEKLTGLQLTIRFRGEQKNQKESFPLLYDLDRDGMFTSFDVDYFTDVINKLDEGATRGKELIHKFKLQIFPQNNNFFQADKQ